MTPPPLPGSGQEDSSPGGNPFAWFLYSWRHYADFSGRARRREWWSFWFINCIPYVLVALFTSPLENVPEDQIPAGQSAVALASLLVLAVYWLASLTPFLSVTARRFHDIGMSAWWMLLIFVPLVGGIFMTVCCLLPGQKTANRFGNPVPL
jgi:uncharacterized membrane protein YhaH (DUF805 family)